MAAAESPGSGSTASLPEPQASPGKRRHKPVGWLFRAVRGPFLVVTSAFAFSLLVGLLFAVIVPPDSPALQCDAYGCRSDGGIAGSLQALRALLWIVEACCLVWLGVRVVRGGGSYIEGFDSIVLFSALTASISVALSQACLAVTAMYFQVPMSRLGVATPVEMVFGISYDMVKLFLMGVLFTFGGVFVARRRNPAKEENWEGGAR
jgi:hypothetical protein